MHVLGHSFSQRRKSSKRPRDLHIRKVSFSGSSLSSGCSLSSSSSTSTFTPRAYNVPGLPSHNLPSPSSPQHPPPRLNDRPFIHTERTRNEEAETFYDDDDDDDDAAGEDVSVAAGERVSGDGFLDEDGVQFEMMRRPSDPEPPRDMRLPPHSSPLDHTAHDRQQPQDYFLLQLAKRPPLQRSHWSESTIQTLDLDLDDLDGTPAGGSVATTSTPSEAPAATSAPASTPTATNFSLKRPAPAPKRPPPFQHAAGGAVENLLKRGGWKRRGIVFNGEEVDTSEEDDLEGDDDDVSVDESRE